jgi:hypothetical protein
MIPGIVLGDDEEEVPPFVVIAFGHVEFEPFFLRVT